MKKAAERPSSTLYTLGAHALNGTASAISDQISHVREQKTVGGVMAETLLSPLTLPPRLLWAFMQTGAKATGMAINHALGAAENTVRAGFHGLARIPFIPFTDAR